MFRPTFGCPLDVHLRIKEREIAVVLEECILFLLETAMDAQVNYLLNNFYLLITLDMWQ